MGSASKAYEYAPRVSSVFSLTVLFIILGALVLACAPATAPAEPQPTDSPAEPAEAEEPTEAAEEPIRGGTAVLALGGDPDHINPCLGWGPSGAVGAKIVDGLVETSADLVDIRPELATSWEVSEDGLTYTFQLRENVVWHDGEPFTSEDVKWSFENLNRYHPMGQRWYPKVDSIDTPDSHTVVIRMNEPFAPLLNSLSVHNGGAICPKHIGEQADDPRSDETLNRAPIGTGPFVFEEWVSGERIAVSRNENYWGPGLPYLDQIVFTVIPDASARVLSLEAGEVNWIDYIYTPNEEVPHMEDLPGIQVNGGLSVPFTEYLFVNHRRSPLDNSQVRKALFMGIDHDFMRNNVYAGLGTIPRQLIDHRLPVAAHPNLDLQEMYPHDVEQAKQMLDEAGVVPGDDGYRFEVGILFEAGRGNFADIAEALRSMWDEIEVRAVPEPVERAILIDRAFQQRDFDVFLVGYTSLGDPALGVSRAYVCESDEEPSNFGNPSGYCREQVDDLFQQASVTPNFDTRREYYIQLQEILAEDLPNLISMGTQGWGLSDTEFEYSGVLKTYGGYSGWETVHRLP